MRLSPTEIELIKNAVDLITPGAKVFLFGSRTDDTKRGGDIDLLVLGEIEDQFHAKGAIWTELQNRLGEQKIDVVVAKPNTDDLFVKSIMSQAQELK